MMETQFSELRARDVIMGNSIQEYERQMDFFHSKQLVPLNASIFVMERILKFPLGLFTDLGDRTFFALILRNFFDAGLLTMTRLATDTKGDFLTLLRFKNWVCKQVKEEYRTDFRRHLKKCRFDQGIRALFDKARQLRNTRVAHITKDFQISEQDRIDFDEFKRLRDSLNLILDSLSFDVDRLMLPIRYSPRTRHARDVDSRSDIEKILDAIARDSGLLNSPEDEPEYWPIRRKTLLSADLAILNEYRAKFGLPEA